MKSAIPVFRWNTQANGRGDIYEVGANVPNSVTALYAQWVEPAPPIPEQFSLPVGETYYFDLSNELGTVTDGVSDKIGTINTGSNAIIVNEIPIGIPDATLHYVPFTYAGTVKAYSLNSQSSGNTNSSVEAGKFPTYRSLFVSDYNVSRIPSPPPLHQIPPPTTTV